MNKHLWGQDMTKDIWICLQAPEAVLRCGCFPRLRYPLATGKEALAQVCALPTGLSVDTADCVHREWGHRSTWVGWGIARDAGLPLTYGDLVNALTVCPGGLNTSGQYQRSLELPTRVPNW